MLVPCLTAPLGLVAIGLALHPDPRGYGTHEQLGFKPCLPMELWHVPCPGCGVTTAVTLAVRGAPLASLRTQPFGLVTIAIALAAAVWALVHHARGRDLYLEFQRLPWKKLGTRVVGVLLLCWAYKLALVRGWLG